MAKIQIAHLVGKANKSGFTRWYWQPSATLARAGWPPVALGKDREAAIRTAEQINAQVARWKAGEPLPATRLPAAGRRHKAGTIGALIERYRREHVQGHKPGTDAPRLRPKTREVYETSLRRIEAWAGQRPVAWVTPARVRALRDTSLRGPERGGIGHAATFNLLRVLRQVLAFAESIEVIPRGSNPAASFDLGKPAPRKTVWTIEDDAAFDAAAHELGLPSLALARELALFTAQREGDLIAFTEPQLQPLDILEPVLRERLADSEGRVMGWCLAQTKTSTDEMDVRLEIPLEPQLLGRVREALRRNRARDRAGPVPRLISHVLVDDRSGEPWTARAFIRAWTMVLEHAAARTGRPAMRELVWHDLRRTRVVRLRRRGLPKEMIAALTGHSLRAIEEMLRVYGPIDPTITASAIVASLDPLPRTADTPAKENAR